MKKNWLFNKTAVITGASGGIGFSVAKTLIEKYDCKVIGIARNEEKIKNAIDSLGEKKGNFSYLLFDVSKKENWQILTDYLDKNGIVPDILINNAGFMLPFKTFEKISDEEIEEITETNFKAALYSVKRLLPYLKRSKSSAIINISSAAGLCAVVGESMYCATKYAVRGFTETLRVEYYKKIYVAGVYPGFIATDITSRMSLKGEEKKTVNKMMMPLDKATKKIVKGIAKKKNHIALGKDGKAMAFFNKLFPKATPLIIAKVLKLSKMEMFDDIK